MLLQACIASVSLGSASTETFHVNHAVVKDGHAITASITVFNWLILNAPRCQWPAVAATNNSLFEFAGTDIAALLLADLIAAMSLANTGAAITLIVEDVSTSAQRIILPFTCRSPASAVASCFPSGAPSYCRCGKDMNALLCTCVPPKTTVCVECASEHDVLRLRVACTVASGAACECHNCAMQQITSPFTEICTRRLPRLTYATTGVSSHYFMTDPVSASEPLTVSLLLRQLYQLSG